MLALFNLNESKAQLKINGTVKGEKGKVLEFVSISLFNTKSTDLIKPYTAFTDTSGYYEFSVPDTGEYIIKALNTGYLTYSSNPIHLSITNKVVVLNIVLQSAIQQLNQVTIQSRKPMIERKGDRLIFNVEGNAATAGNPLLEVLRMVPGISVINDKLSVRGKEGLVIMIDNRRTYMSGDELLNYLKNTPAEAISQMEVITNPSARYDSEGNVGIINIKTKRNTLDGTTGTLTQTIGYNKFLKSNTGGQVTYANKSLTLYGNSYLAYNKGYDNYYTENESAGVGKIRNNNYSERVNKNSYSYQAGFEYRLNKHSTLGGVIDGSLRPEFNTNGLSTIERMGANPQYIISLNQATTDQRSNANNLHYSWNNDKNTDVFSADINYVTYDYNLISNQLSNYYVANNHQQVVAEEQLRNSNLRKINVFAGKADYTHKLNEKHNIESGIKWSSVETAADLVYEQLQQNDWVNDPGRTNQYQFTEQIYAGYLNYSGQFGTYTIQAGLRAEQTNNTGISKTTGSEVKRDYLKLFPSFLIGRTFLKNHFFNLSYSYRVDRPTYSYLNPFTFINNPYSYFRGNPYLKPQYTHALEGNYDYKKKVFLTIGYSRTTDLITEISEAGQQPEVVGGTRTNINAMNSYNITVNAPIQPTKNWNINLYLGGFRNSIMDNTGFSNAQTTFTATLNSSLTLPKEIVLDVNGDYQSAMSYGTIRLQPMYGVNAGLRKAFLSNQLNIRLNVSDVFKTQKFTYQSNYAAIQSYGINTSESRVLRLTANYKFGSIKAAVKRKMGAEEEQKRAGN